LIRKGFFTLVVVAALLLAFSFAGGLSAASKAADVIKMENKIYDKHTRPIVNFTHKKHAEDYKIGCGDCHHDEKGRPLTNLKPGDPVQGCAECHSKPGEKPKGKDAPKLTRQQELEYHAEAVHENCRGCHRDHNKKTGTKDAPTLCTACHQKG
jgi:hypothetical protein